MKYIHPCIVLAATCILAACAAETPKTPALPSPEKLATLPPGMVIAADSMPVAEDKLNNFVFSVKISTTEKTSKGNYAVDAAWGYNTANGEIMMPKNDELLTPILKRTGEPYTYIIGFYVNGDTTFYDYYEVSATKGIIAMRYTKGYRFQ